MNGPTQNRTGVLPTSRECSTIILWGRNQKLQNSYIKPSSYIFKQLYLRVTMGLFKKKRAEYKFCPVCGTQLKASDAYCLRCGYSFEARRKKSRKAIKWRNIILMIIVLALIYFGIRYYYGQAIIPVSLEDALNFTTVVSR